MSSLSSPAEETPKLRVLLVGDSEALAATQLSLPPGVAKTFVRVGNVLQALDSAGKTRPGVISLDSVTSHRPVSEVARWLGSDERTSGVPVMFVTTKPASPHVA